MPLDVCTYCGWTWQEFREKGVLGGTCCYESLHQQLEAYSSIHFKKLVHGQSAPVNQTRSQKVVELKKMLQFSLKHEKFEEALSIKKQLEQLNRPPSIHD